MRGVQAGSEPPLLRTLLESVARQLEMGRGSWRLELDFVEGRLRHWRRLEGRQPVAALARYEHGARTEPDAGS